MNKAIDLSPCSLIDWNERIDKFFFRSLVLSSEKSAIFRSHILIGWEKRTNSWYFVCTYSIQSVNSHFSHRWHIRNWQLRCEIDRARRVLPCSTVIQCWSLFIIIIEDICLDVNDFVWFLIWLEYVWSY
jgi:hypothetical protein